MKPRRTGSPSSRLARRLEDRAANRLPDTHRAGRGNTERHHERERGDVDRDLMRGERGGREPARQRRRRGEHSDLERDLTRRGQPRPISRIVQSTRSDSHRRSRICSDSRRGLRAARSLAIDNDGQENAGHA